MTVKLKTITETAWLVLGDTDDTKIGLLTEIKDNYILMVKGEKKQFLNRKEVNKYFNEDIFNNIIKEDIVTDSKKEYYVNGYPTDFPEPHEVILKGTDLPLYSKKASSETYYCAGYYCLYFDKNIMQAFCPKLGTLQEYRFAGPWKTEFEMRHELVKLRKERSAKQ